MIVVPWIMLAVARGESTMITHAHTRTVTPGDRNYTRNTLDEDTMDHPPPESRDNSAATNCRAVPLPSDQRLLLRFGEQFRISCSVMVPRFVSVIPCQPFALHAFSESWTRFLSRYEKEKFSKFCKFGLNLDWIGFEGKIFPRQLLINREELKFVATRLK